MKNLITVLYHPTKTFEQLREKGNWVPAFFVLLVVILINLALMLPAMDELQKQSLQLQGRTEPPLGWNFIHIASFFGGVIGISVSVFFGALLLLLVNLFVRGSATYMQLVHVSLYAKVPTMISGLISGILVRTLHMTSIKNTSISLGVFFSDKQGFLYGIANLLNPFIIWSLVLLVIGTTVMTRTSRIKTGSWIVGGWLFFSIAGVFVAVVMNQLLTTLKG